MQSDSDRIEELENKIAEQGKIIDALVKDYKELVEHYNEHGHVAGEDDDGMLVVYPIGEWNKKDNEFEVSRDLK